MKFTPIDVTDLTDELEVRRRRRERVSETRGGCVLVLSFGAGLIASRVAEGWTVVWLTVVIFLMCVSVALLAACEAVNELKGDDDGADAE